MALPGMEQVVAADGLGLRIVQEGVGPTGFLEMSARLLDRVGADRDDADAAPVEVRKPLLETP